MSSAQGRFTSPDPKQVTARHLTSPQKWNKYAYVQNYPLASIDPDGLDDYRVSITANLANPGGAEDETAGVHASSLEPARGYEDGGQNGAWKFKWQNLETPSSP